ncbi:MAG: ketoacyl-ACP synthase III [Calditrichaeota bacterium]|nr:ketoacyl-ACP synthase III [Calditrichota bacterium]MCB9366486.1 ketoacyl-ACP synthase III [Calditrichota bacterium]MCB9391256.1 ketoacyl-ACP synthase III [Calditrichota bacterium]
MSKGVKPVSRIVGLGVSYPDNIMTNQDLEKIVETNDEWITTRTGIKERHLVKRGERTSDFCIRAAREALAEAGIAAEELDAIILGTISGDLRFPATATLIQEAIGAKNAAAWDISATCSGFMFSLYSADTLIAANRAKNVLVLGAELLTPITDWSDRGTCVLFGDAAGAAVVTRATDDRGVLSVVIGSNGSYTDLLYCVGHGTSSKGELAALNGERVIHMNGNEVFRHAVRMLERTAKEAVEKAGLDPADVDWLIPHQANTRIIAATAERLGLPMEKVFLNIHKYGNTSSASVPLAMYEARKEGALRDGQVMLSVVFGGGFTWGGAVIRF